MKNERKEERNATLRKLFLDLTNPDREGGAISNAEAFRQVLKIAREKFFINSIGTVKAIIYEQGVYERRQKNIQFRQKNIQVDS